jgi:transcriptional regulator with XRE-family HTH domain
MINGTRSSPPGGARELARSERDLKRAIGTQVRTLREDAGLTPAAVARAAGIDRAHYARIETGDTGASLGVLIGIGMALGTDLSVRFFPGSSPRLRDRFQAPMVEALVRLLDPGWVATPEVPIFRPVRGVIDLVLRREGVTIACEVQSELRRLEQVLRWSAEKAAALGDGSGPPGEVSRLLVLRSTTATRVIARRFEGTLAAAYPATAIEALRALRRADRPWPGAAIIWARVEAGRATILERPPRGVHLGR